MSSIVRNKPSVVTYYGPDLSELRGKLTVWAPNGVFLVASGKGTVRLNEEDFLFFSVLAGASIIKLHDADDKSDFTMYDIVMSDGNVACLQARDVSQPEAPRMSPEAPVLIPPCPPAKKEETPEPAPKAAMLREDVREGVVSPPDTPPATSEVPQKPSGNVKVPMMLSVPLNEADVLKEIGMSTAEVLAIMNRQTAASGQPRTTRIRLGSLIRTGIGTRWDQVVVTEHPLMRPLKDPAGRKTDSVLFGLHH